MSENETPEETQEQQPHAAWARCEIERRRKLAYADPETGSDRHFNEAARLDASGDTDGAALARSAGLVRVAEIQAALPYSD